MFCTCCQISATQRKIHLMPISQNGWSLRKTLNSNTTLGWLERLMAECMKVSSHVVPEKYFTLLQVTALATYRQFAGTAAVVKILYMQW